MAWTRRCAPPPRPPSSNASRSAPNSSRSRCPHTEFAVGVYYIIATAEASANLARFDGVRYGHRADAPKDLLDHYKRTREEGFGSEVKRRIILGTYVLSSGYYDAYYLRAQKVRTLIRQDFTNAFAKVDALICPTSPDLAFKLGERTDDPLRMYLADIFTIAANLAGICGVSVPCGFGEVDGKKLPIACNSSARRSTSAPPPGRRTPTSNQPTGTKPRPRCKRGPVAALLSGVQGLGATEKGKRRAERDGATSPIHGRPLPTQETKRRHPRGRRLFRNCVRDGSKRDVVVLGLGRARDARSTATWSGWARRRRVLVGFAATACTTTTGRRLHGPEEIGQSRRHAQLAAFLAVSPCRPSCRSCRRPSM